MTSNGEQARARRAYDQVDRRTQQRKLWGTAVLVAAVFVVAFGYWTWGDGEPARDGAPNWASDGTAIVFAAEVGEARGDIFIMNADGSGRRRLTTDPANDTNPALSPDGTRIAFESDRDGNSEIYVMDRNGRNPRRLTTDPARDASPAWSPDGTRIAFTSDRDNRASADVYIMRADGSGLERITSDLANWAPQFSPDGRELAVQIGRDVWVITLATGARRRLTFDPQNGMNPTWSHDGRRIAFVSTRNRKAEILTMNADGSDPRVLVTMPAAGVIDPRWSPEGSHIAFVMVPDETNTQPLEAVQAIYTIELGSEKLTRVSR
jgi:Tol biopolymer transport system component